MSLVLVYLVQFIKDNESKTSTKVYAHVSVCVCVRTSIIVRLLLNPARLSGYGFINIGLPPASPSNQEVDEVSKMFSECAHITQPSLFLPKVISVAHFFLSTTIS